MLKEIIVQHVKKERKSIGLRDQQKAPLIMNVFTRKMTSAVKVVLGENHILVTNVPANMIRFYQPWNLTMNGGVKRFITKKFNGWYS